MTQVPAGDMNEEEDEGESKRRENDISLTPGGGYPQVMHRLVKRGEESYQFSSVSSIHLPICLLIQASQRLQSCPSTWNFTSNFKNTVDQKFFFAENNLSI